MYRRDILETATQYVTKDRAADHGDMEDNFRLIAEYWSLHLDCDVAADDVGVMMALLKVARMKGNPAHGDNYIDGCGYLACAGEIADRMYGDD
jgi:hypothetical protein